MPSTLTWLDHDVAAHERTKRILALFQERRTQDQLGLGGIRDSFADLFFPGTSTIQTRLRYFLFVPWIYRSLEEEEVPSHRFGAAARERELALIEPLLSLGEDGVFGRMAGEGLKRLPSSVYWGGLGSWGIRLFSGDYHRAVDELYRRRRAERQRAVEGVEDGGTLTWHRELPPAPASFPDEVTLDLTYAEAEFLRDRIAAAHRGSLLAWLAFHPAELEGVQFVWEHPLHETMPEGHRHALRHARLLSEVMSGAPLLYNWMLSEALGRDDWVDRYRERHAGWVELLDRDALGGWSVGECLDVARSQGGHTITPHAERFVRRWVELTLADAEGLPYSEDARSLVRRREMLLKGARSLFRNRRAREERYQGELGVGQLEFRWTDVRRLLQDLYAGLARR